jgi:hypothetical protein
MDEDASSAFEMNLAVLTLKWLSLTAQSCSHPSPSSNQLKDLLKEGFGEWNSVLGGVLACGVSSK